MAGPIGYRTDMPPRPPGFSPSRLRQHPAAWLALAVACVLLAAGLRAAQVATPPAVAPPSADRVAAVRAYIATGWTTLSRSLADLPEAAADPKMPLGPGEAWPVYVARSERLDDVRRTIDAILEGERRAAVTLLSLPAQATSVERHGLLYLPRPYVVPGGRFNEMYGWDSYFINVGLLHDGEIARARDMVDNFVYQVTHYGTILNANRTYYLTRSQPPLLTPMVRDVYRHTLDRTWLAGTWQAIERYYAFWTTPPHLDATTGLSRYYDTGEGPAPEVVSDEKDEAGRTHYDRVKAFYRTTPIDDYDVTEFYDRAADRLTPLFYKGDRSMRESGFDPSNRFGPFSVDIVHYAPVCLNSLLYQMEVDAAAIAAELGRDDVTIWHQRAERRRAAIGRYLWDEEAGLYFDFNVRHGRRRPYEFATTFYPLWVGAASPDQARRVVTSLPRLEAAGGLLTSTVRSGSQWDAPFGWAPLQLIAVRGLRRYGFDDDADRIASKFLELVTKEFEEHRVIVEKYDVVARESEVSAGITFGYSSNEIGFGWTNAAYLDLLAGLRERRQ